MKASDYGLQKDDDGKWYLVHIKSKRVYRRLGNRYRPTHPWFRQDTVPRSERYPQGIRDTNVGLSTQEKLDSICKQKMKEAKQ